MIIIVYYTLFMFHETLEIAIQDWGNQKDLRRMMVWNTDYNTSGHSFCSHCFCHLMRLDLGEISPTKRSECVALQRAFLGHPVVSTPVCFQYHYYNPRKIEERLPLLFCQSNGYFLIHFWYFPTCQTSNSSIQPNFLLGQ